MLNGTDYFPFGSEMRSSRLANYRFGFNGKELDKSQEFGILNAYDYGFRIYNPGIGRFLSVDPLIQKYPELTPYQFASNTPIQAIDLDGLEAINVNPNVYWLQQGRSLFNHIQNNSADDIMIASSNRIVKMLDPEDRTRNLDESSKQQLFKNDSRATLGILMREFTNGDGEYKRIFRQGEHAIADAINQNNDLVNRAIDKFYNINLAYKNDVSFSQAIEQIKPDRGYGYPFSPAANIDALLYTIPRHVEATLEMANGDFEKFFAGGMLFFFENHDKYIEIVFQNQTSRSSLGLHSAKDRENGPLSNKIQQYRYKVSKPEFEKQLSKRRTNEQINDK